MMQAAAGSSIKQLRNIQTTTGGNMNMKSTNKWASKMGFILATAGAAIGLGNLWKFPYLM